MSTASQPLKTRTGASHAGQTGALAADTGRAARRLVLNALKMRQWLMDHNGGRNEGMAAPMGRLASWVRSYDPPIR